MSRTVRACSVCSKSPSLSGLTPTSEPIIPWALTSFQFKAEHGCRSTQVTCGSSSPASTDFWGSRFQFLGWRVYLQVPILFIIIENIFYSFIFIDNVQVCELVTSLLSLLVITFTATTPGRTMEQHNNSNQAGYGLGTMTLGDACKEEIHGIREGEKSQLTKDLRHVQVKSLASAALHSETFAEVFQDWTYASVSTLFCPASQFVLLSPFFCSNFIALLAYHTCSIFPVLSVYSLSFG